MSEFVEVESMKAFVYCMIHEKRSHGIENPLIVLDSLSWHRFVAELRTLAYPGEISFDSSKPFEFMGCRVYHRDCCVIVESKTKGEQR